MTNLISEKKFKIEVTPGKHKERIDLFLTNVIEHATRTRIQKLIEAGLVLVNGKTTKANYKIIPGDLLDVTIPITPRPEKAEPEDIPLNIVFEDEYLLVVNKPAGMVAHPAFSNYTGTLVNALLHHTKNLSDVNEPGRPGIVHRIDKNTSGLLVVAKDDHTHAQLAKQFAKHSIEREYWTIAWGIFKTKSGEISDNIVRSKSDRKKFTTSKEEGKTAFTMYEVIEEFAFASLLKIHLRTGRTHQIRVHLSCSGHPVFGDETYGGRKLVFSAQYPKLRSRMENLLEMMPRQALHAKKLGFVHPVTGQTISFDSELPEDFQNLLLHLRKN